MQRCADGQQQLEFVYWMLVVATPSQAIDFEQRLQVEEECEHQLNVIVMFIKHGSRPSIVLEMHARCYNTIGQNDGHHDHAEVRRT